MISIIIDIEDISSDIAAMLYSLSAQYQENICPENWEILLITTNPERSVPDLSPGSIPVRSILKSGTPCESMQTALQAVNGNCIGFVFNQHHVLSPRAFEYTEIALKMHENALVVIPGYTTTQVNPDRVSHDTVATLGYKLFADAKFSPINPQGFMCPMHGFGFMACRKAVAQKQLDSIHGKVAPHHADLMDALYQAIGRDEKMSLSIIPGEGAFSPDHLTSPEKNKRHQNPPLCREPFLIGSITYAAQKFFAESSEHASKRFQSLAEQGAPYWSHDPAGRYSENTSSDSAPSKTWVTIPIRPVEFWE